MRTPFNFEHLIKVIESGRLETTPEFSTVKTNMLSYYTELKKLVGLGEKVEGGCTSCRQKNINFRKQSMLMMAVISLNTAYRNTGNLDNFTTMLTELMGTPITQLDLVMPTRVAPRTNMRQVNAGNTIVSKGTV